MTQQLRGEIPNLARFYKTVLMVAKIATVDLYLKKSLNRYFSRTNKPESRSGGLWGL